MIKAVIIIWKLNSAHFTVNGYFLFVNNLVKKLAKLIYVVRGGATACGFSELPMELELENQ